MFKIIQFKHHGIAQPPDLPTLKAYPTPGVDGRFGIFSLQWRERINLKVPWAILPHGCTILSTRAKTVRGLLQPPLGELGLIMVSIITFSTEEMWPYIIQEQKTNKQTNKQTKNKTKHTKKKQQEQQQQKTNKKTKNKTKQTKNKTKQNKTKQNKTKQNKTKT